MLEQELKKVWQQLKERWKSSPQTEKIDSEVSTLMNELKGKISKFEKDSISRDITKITTSIKKIIEKFRMNK